VFSFIDDQGMSGGQGQSVAHYGKIRKSANTKPVTRRRILNSANKVAVSYQ
jgi:hypothetical protein